MDVAFFVDAAAAMSSVPESQAWYELEYWRELARQNESILQKELSLRHELECRNEELEERWVGLRGELERLKASRAATEEEAAQLADSLRRVESKQQSTEKQVSELTTVWNQSAEQFKAELDRLERARKLAEMKRQKAELTLKNLQGGRNKLSDQNRRLKKEVSQMASVQEARNDEKAKLQELNTLALKRVKQMKQEVKELKAMLEKEKDARIASEIFAQAEVWNCEAQTYKLDRNDESLEMERKRSASLEEQLRKRDEEVKALQRALVASTQTAAEAELALFYAKIRAEQSEEAAAEARMHAARCQEATEDANRQREGAYQAVEKMMMERQECKKMQLKLQGERDFFEWMLLEKSGPQVIEWIEPGEQLMPQEDPDGWHENTLFGVQNDLYESE